jgi:hypothetical protein
MPGIKFSAYRIHFPVLRMLDLTNNKLFIPPLQILLNHLADRPAPCGAGGDPKGAEPLWPQ